MMSIKFPRLPFSFFLILMECHCQVVTNNARFSNQNWMQKVKEHQKFQMVNFIWFDISNEKTDSLTHTQNTMLAKKKQISCTFYWVKVIWLFSSSFFLLLFGYFMDWFVCIFRECFVCCRYFVFFCFFLGVKWE